MDLGLIARDAASHRIFLESFGVGESPASGVAGGTAQQLRDQEAADGRARGSPPGPLVFSNAYSLERREFKYAAFTAYTVWAARWAGRHFPWPEHVPLENAEVVARWIAAMAAEGLRRFWTQP